MVRLWAAAPNADFEFTVGPIPWADKLGKELISRMSTSLNTNAMWNTDSNCRDSMKVREAREGSVCVRHFFAACVRICLGCELARYCSCIL